jgi:inorganic pyrophosphatase
MSSSIVVPEEELVQIMIEIPKGSRNKYEFDPDSGYIRFDRMLSSPVRYPSDYGYIRGTLALDGRPIGCPGSRLGTHLPRLPDRRTTGGRFSNAR